MPKCFRILRSRATLVWREQVLEYKTTTVAISIWDSFMIDADPPCPGKNDPGLDSKLDPNLDPKTSSGSEFQNLIQIGTPKLAPD